MIDILITKRPNRKNIILFQRRLTRSIAGGARSVFDRARFLQSSGYDVTFVVMDKSHNPGVALTALRREGILHPKNDVLFVQDLLTTAEDHLRALSAPLLRPALPAEAKTVDTHKNGRLVRRTYVNGDVVRHVIAFFMNGEIRLQESFDAEGRLTEKWIHDSTGDPLYIDRFDPKTGSALTRRLVCGGRHVFCDIDMTAPFGLGMSTRPGTAPVSYARRVAASLEDRFDGVDDLAVIADGENISQNILRAFQPGLIKGISVLHNNHTDAPYTPDAPLKPGWESFIEDMTNVSRVVALTGRQFDDLSERFPQMRLVTVNHPALPVAQAPVARDFNKVVFVGRLSHQKRLDHLVGSFAHIARLRPATTFDVYGKGDQQNWLAELIAEAGIENQVTLHGFTDQPLRAFASAGLSLMTSYYEGLPLTLLEAMSVGTPFVAYDLNYGPAEVIRDGVDGVLVENGNPEAVAQAAVALLDDPARLVAISKAAREITRRYTLDAHKELWSMLLEEIMTPVTEAHR